MKLLVCTQVVDKNHPILGFFTRWLLEFSKHFDRIDVICLEVGEYDLPPHVHIHSLGKEKGSLKIIQLLRFYRYFARTIFHERPHYVFFHMGAIYNILAAPFFLLRKITKTKFIWWKAHGGTTLAEKLSLGFVDEVYTPTAGSFPVNTKKKRVVGHAVDTESFVPSTINKQSDHILFVGRIMPVKNIELAIEFAKQTGLPLEIVGPVVDQKYKERLEQQIDVAFLSEQVEFVGSRTREALVKAYQAASLVINASRTGSVDKVVLEALACGTPVLAPCDTYKEILGPFGLCVEGDTASSYAEVYKNYQPKSESMLHQYVASQHSLKTLPQRIFKLE